jgi:hypothetical protein
VQELVERIVVGHGEIQITQKVAATSPSSGEPRDYGDEPKIYTAPLPVPAPRARKEIIIPGGRERALRKVSQDLVLAIARARTWMRALREGTYRDTKEIARRFKLNDAHIRRILRIGYLAPDIIEAVAEGRQPRSLTVKRLLQRMPCAWHEQRISFGLAPDR